LHAAGGVVQHFGRGEPRIDLDAQRFGLLRQPAAEIAEADDVIAVIRHLRRRRQAQRTGFRQQQEAVFRRRSGERGALFAPVRDQLAQYPRLEHRPGQDVGADLGALLDDAYAELTFAGRGELLQSDRRSEA